MEETKQSVMIFSNVGVLGSPDIRRGLKNAIESASGRVSEVAVATLQENMRRFLHSLSVILSASSEDVGGLTLDTVEVSAQIDGKGNIGITGVGSAELAAHGGIKLILKRKG